MTPQRTDIPRCLIRRSDRSPDLNSDWMAFPGDRAETIELACVREESSSHRPRVRIKTLHDGASISVRFLVHDPYVRCVHTGYQDPVCRDICVEWFAQPRPDRGYINFEINCGGALHASYIEDPTRTPDGFKKRQMISPDDARDLRIRHTLPEVVEPERTEPTVWEVGIRIPVSFFEKVVGVIGDPSGRT